MIVMEYIEVFFRVPGLIPFIVITTIGYYAFRQYVRNKVAILDQMYKYMPTSTKLTGAEATRKLLDANELTKVCVEETGGFLSDHYDSYAQAIRLSTDHFHKSTLLGIAIAAHEVGHAIQNKEDMPAFYFRQNAFSFVMFIKKARIDNFLLGLSGVLLVFAVLTEFAFASLMLIGGYLSLLVGLGLPLFYTLVTLKVEADASARAIDELQRLSMITPEEKPVVMKILAAAKLTYVWSIIKTSFGESGI